MSTSGKRHLAAKDLFGLALERQASDLHLKAGRPPILRIGGAIHVTDLAAMSADEVADLAMGLMDARARAYFEEHGAADFALMHESGERFRINVYRQRGCTSLAARRVTRIIPGFGELHLPEKTMLDLCEAREGLVVFAGVRGTGKSTSLAACLEYINQHRRCHIVTVEDPIEYVFEDKQAFVDQREIGTDVPSFIEALRCLAREDPDVVLVGEIRDRATCEAVIRAAESSHLVFTTVHATSAPGVISRLLELFPTEDRPLIRDLLASNLRAVVCQKLLAGADPNVPRVPATEVMLASPTVRTMIREADMAMLANMIAADKDFGMHDFTSDLARLVREEWVDPKTAYESAPNPEALKMAIRGIDVKRGTMR
jgi:twitching motility protein PilT